MKPVLGLVVLFFSGNLFADASADRALRIQKINEAKTITQQLELSVMEKSERDFLLEQARKAGLKILPQAEVNGNTLTFKGMKTTYKLVAVDPTTGRYSLNDYAFKLNAKDTRQERFDYLARVVRKVAGDKSAFLNLDWLPRAEAEGDWLTADVVSVSGWRQAARATGSDDTFQDIISDLNDSFKRNHRMRLTCKGVRGGVIEMVSRSDSEKSAPVVTRKIELLDRLADMDCEELGEVVCERRKRMANTYGDAEQAVTFTTNTDGVPFGLQQRLKYTVANEKTSDVSGLFKCDDKSGCYGVKTADLKLVERSPHDEFMSKQTTWEPLVALVRECCMSTDKSCVREINSDEKFGLDKVSPATYKRNQSK